MVNLLIKIVHITYEHSTRSCHKFRYKFNLNEIKYPEDNSSLLQHSESLKSRKFNLVREKVVKTGGRACQEDVLQ
jgi:hypothetical protein